MLRPFRQVDVFTALPYLGNPLAVVLDGSGLSTAEMQRFAQWTNLSETTFVLPPTSPDADYRVRIFHPEAEIPFAGHPTLGTCHAWLEAGGVPHDPSEIVQECGSGLMPRTTAPPVLSTTWPQVLALRLARQHVLEREATERLVDVVGEMIGLHAQVMSSAELQAAARIDGLRPADVRDALWQRRRLVKVWAFRQTLHLLTADDLAEFVVAARSLERRHTPAWLRYFKMTEEGVDQVLEAIGEVLGERPMTRVEVVDAVVARVRRPHLREDMLTGWGTFLGPAAQRGKLVFGPSDGRNVAFVDPSDWLGRAIGPGSTREAAEAARGRLIARYLSSFPGSSRGMIGRWWGGRTAITKALELVPVPLVEVDVEGTRGLVREGDVDALAGTTPEHEARLLPGFDPFTNELPRRVDSVLKPADHDAVHRVAGWVTPIVVIDGRVAGTWGLTDGKAGAGTVVVKPFARWRGGARNELKPEVERIAAFLDRPLRLEIGSSG